MKRAKIQLLLYFLWTLQKGLALKDLLPLMLIQENPITQGRQGMKPLEGAQDGRKVRLSFKMWLSHKYPC